MAVTTLLVAGAVVGAAGQAKQGKDAKAAGNRQKKFNDLQADDALLIGTKEEERYRRHIAMVAGEQRAEFGNRNVIASGTALDILSDTAQIGEEDVANIRTNAAREAWALRHAGKEAKRAGKSAYTSSLFSAGSTLLTSGAQAYGSWKD